MPAPPPGRLQEMLSDTNYFQQVMSPESERQNPRPGRIPQEMAGGGSGAAPRGPKPYPQEVEDVLNAHARGAMKSQDVKKFLKDKGWSVDLRRGRYDYEAVDPAGNYHYIQP